ncbi:hypothetical protein [Spongiimicrobium salis]|uniref:hypothetical protein n=1 Tax=Spongiimicrobium salis TaxID=1667022 RepID=UPI00374DEE6D
MDQQVKEEGKTMAIISYITVIGLLIAFIMNNSKNNAFAQFHIGQSVRIAILGAANYVLNWFLPSGLWFISSIISLGILVFMILGVVNAINLKDEPLPVIGTIG